LTPYTAPSGELKVSLEFACEEWKDTVKNLTLELSIDGRDWSECFLSKKGLMSDLGWNASCDNRMSGMCGRHNSWNCGSMGCKHNDYNLWVKSKFSEGYVNITFVCKLPTLSAGSHTLNVVAKVYGSEITLIPSRATFMVIFTAPTGIVKILLLPLEILRNILPF